MNHVMILSMAAILGATMAGCSNTGSDGRSTGSSIDNGARTAGTSSGFANDPDGIHDSRGFNGGSSGGFGTGSPPRAPTGTDVGSDGGR